MHRFFVAPGSIEGENVTLTGEVAGRLERVLRMRPGDQIVVLDDSGWEYLVSLDRVTAREVHGRVTRRVLGKGEPQTRITLFQAVLKAGKFELVLQKGTELGVSAFVPFFCERSVPRDSGGRHERWQKIIKEAAEQSRRGRLPVLSTPVDFAGACAAADGPALIPWEEEGATGLKAALRALGKRAQGAPVEISVLTGPEGGFTQEEIELAREKGAVPVSLGSRILRAETAGIATVAAIMYEFGELGRD
jgi:16S rRNA (uracil1498-N3)-methyltransferase